MGPYQKPREGKEYGFEQVKKADLSLPGKESLVEQHPNPENRENISEQETSTPEQVQPVRTAAPSQSDEASAVPDDLATKEGTGESHRVHLLVSMAMQEGVDRAVEEARDLFNKGQISSHGLDQFHDTLMDECKGRLKM